jgi:Ca2+-binding RTX toxin-like protein
MGTVSFANLDQAFSSADNAIIAFSSLDASSPTAYSYLTTGGDDWDLAGSGLAFAGSLPTGGTINSFSLDLDNDASAAEFTLSGVSLAATSLGVGSGTADQQRDAFWAAALGGADTINLTLLNYSVALTFAGDGADISDGAVHLGANDNFVAGASGLSGDAALAGDYLTISDGDASGGNDTFTASGSLVYGDFQQIDAGAFGLGGDDIITPAILVDTPQLAVQIVGDAGLVNGDLLGGNDLIDLRSASVGGYTKGITLVGDALAIGIGGYVLAGDDTIFGSTKGDVIFGDSADDALLQVEGGDDQLFGVNGADTIYGGGGNDTIGGGGGADFLDGGAGADLVQYSDATGALTIDLTTQTVAGTGVAAGDTIAGFEHATGGAAADVIIGSQAVGNFFDGNGGNDSVYGLSGNDTLFGGAGDDFLEGGAGADHFDGGSGSDSVSYLDATTKVVVRLWNGTGSGGFSAGDSYLNVENVFGGSAGDAIVGADNVANFIAGGGGNDSINGLSGADTIRGGSGADNLNGGAGADWLDYTDATGQITVRLWNSTATGDIATGDTIAGFENVRGGSAGDAIVGADGVSNWLIGNGGNDSIQGLSGDDTIRGSAGADNLNGGLGVDTLDLSDATGAVVVRMWNQTATGDIATGDTIAGFENAFGGAGDDAIVGSDATANLLNGNAGNDAMAGLTGNDTLTGAAGNDTLTGGGDNDRFDFAGAFGADRITDFSAGAGVGDVILLTGFGTAFDSFAEVFAASTQVGANTVIDLGGGNTITLLNVAKAALNANDFDFG